jgi:uncharacterized protein DUF5681
MPTIMPPIRTRFRPGQSGNPKGRPKGSHSLSTIIKKTLEQEIDWSRLLIKEAEHMAATYKGNVGWEVLAYVAIAQALGGDMRAAEWLAKSAYGKKLGQADERNAPIPILVDITGEAAPVQMNDEKHDQEKVD